MVPAGDRECQFHPGFEVIYYTLIVAAQRYVVFQVVE